MVVNLLLININVSMRYVPVRLDACFVEVRQVP